MNRTFAWLCLLSAGLLLFQVGCVGRPGEPSAQSNDNQDPPPVDSRPEPTKPATTNVSTTDWSSFGKARRLILPYTTLGPAVAVGPVQQIPAAGNGTAPGARLGTAPGVAYPYSTAPGVSVARFPVGTAPGVVPAFGTAPGVALRPFGGPSFTAPGVRPLPVAIGPGTTAPSVRPGFDFPRGGTTAPGFRPAFPRPFRGGGTAPGIPVPGFRDPNRGFRSPNATAPR